MGNGEGGEEYSEAPPVARCDYCGEPMLTQRGRAKYCSREHKELAREARKRAADRLTTLRQNHPFAVSDDPRQYSDFGDIPGDVELADEIDQELNIEAGTLVGLHPDDIRFQAMLRSDASAARARTPQRTWREWRAYGKRHGTEHPEQTADRIGRHEADQAARAHRINAKTASAPQSPFDSRTSGYVATRATESRRINARHVDRPPMHEQQEFSFEAEQITGSFYRQGRGDGHRAKYSGYAWDIRDGW